MVSRNMAAPSLLKNLTQVKSCALLFSSLYVELCSMCAGGTWFLHVNLVGQGDLQFFMSVLPTRSLTQGYIASVNSQIFNPVRLCLVINMLMLIGKLSHEMMGEVPILLFKSKNNLRQILKTFILFLYSKVDPDCLFQDMDI